jgi:hypothetical protein
MPGTQREIDWFRSLGGCGPFPLVESPFLAKPDGPEGRAVSRRFVRCVTECTAIWKHPLRLVLDYDAVRNSDHVDTTSLDFSTERGRNLGLSLASLPPGLIAVTVLVVRTLTVGRGAACLTKQAAQSAKFRSLDIRSAEGQLRR